MLALKNYLLIYDETDVFQTSLLETVTFDFTRGLRWHLIYQAFDKTLFNRFTDQDGNPYTSPIKGINRDIGVAGEGGDAVISRLLDYIELPTVIVCRKQTFSHVCCVRFDVHLSRSCWKYEQLSIQES